MNDMHLDDVRNKLSKRLETAKQEFRFGVERREQGTISTVADGVARVRGLSEVKLEEIVRIGDQVDALVLDLAENDIGVVLLGDQEKVRAFDSVESTGQVATVPVGDELLGRVIDPLGNALDGLAAIETSERLFVERPAPKIVDRASISEPLFTGITVVDALFPIGRGQRQLIIGDQGTGKTTLALDTVINQRSSGVRCVYAIIGHKASTVVELIAELKRKDALNNTVVVVASAEAAPGLRFLAPYAACSIAEYYRDRGEHALVVFDDLSRHAIAYREISLLLRRPPGREAYPGDIFFVHSRLLERATQFNNQRGGGSLSALPIVETQAGRISDFIPTNLISITDGQLFLNALQFDRGMKPAVDVGLSVSRVGGKTQRTAMKVAAAQLRLDAARFQEVEVFQRFGAKIEDETRKLLRRGERIRELMKQEPASPLSPGEQIALLLCLNQGLFDPVEIGDVQALASKLRGELQRSQAKLLRSLEIGHTPTEQTFSDLERVFKSL